MDVQEKRILAAKMKIYWAKSFPVETLTYMIRQISFVKKEGNISTLSTNLNHLYSAHY